MLDLAGDAESASALGRGFGVLRFVGDITSERVREAWICVSYRVLHECPPPFDYSSDAFFFNCLSSPTTDFSFQYINAVRNSTEGNDSSSA
jgi:hypothetical protein